MDRDGAFDHRGPPVFILVYFIRRFGAYCNLRS
jgi:hypothetical protein